MAWIETPANPTLGLTDFEAVSNWARSHGVLSVADNTFSTPLAPKPLSMGVDVVVHSATKYLAGHGDLLAGAILTSYLPKEQVLPWLDHLGSGLDAQGSWLLQRGLSTFPVRFERHQSNATAVAEWLVSQPGITKVFYPALISNAERDIYLKQMKGGGGVLSFKVEGGAEPARKFMTSLELCANAPLVNLELLWPILGPCTISI